MYRSALVMSSSMLFLHAVGFFFFFGVLSLVRYYDAFVQDSDDKMWVVVCVCVRETGRDTYNHIHTHTHTEKV